MTRTRTLLYGEPDSSPRDGSRANAAEREQRLRQELAQLKPGGWQRGAPATRGTRLNAPPPRREKDPPTLRSVLPPAGPSPLRSPANREPERVRVVLAPPRSSESARIPPPSSRATRPREVPRKTAVLAGSAVGAAVLVGLGVWLTRKGEPSKSMTTPAQRSESAPARRTDSVPARGGNSAPARGSDSLPGQRSNSAPTRGSDSVPGQRSNSAPARRSNSAPARPSESVPARSASAPTATNKGARPANLFYRASPSKANSPGSNTTSTETQPSKKPSGTPSARRK